MTRQWTVAAFCAFMAAFQPLKAQMIRSVENYPRHRVAARYTRGMLIPHSKVMQGLPRGAVQQLEIFYERQTSGRKDWHQHHALPAWRAFFALTDFSNPQAVGLGYTVGGEMSFPLVRTRHFQLSQNTSVGLGFFPRRYRRGIHENQPAIGSLLNYHIRFGFEGSFRLHKHLDLFAGLHFGHWSNGALKMPNLGMNVASFSLGLKGGWDLFYAGKQKKAFPRQPFTLLITASAGYKEIDPPGGKIYPIASLYAEAGKRLTPKSGLSLGADFFYDGSIRAKTLYRQLPDKGERMNFRLGFHAGYEFFVHRFSAFFHFGVYALRYDRLTGILYQRIGLRYQLPKNISLTTALKSHMFTADCVEFGLGYRIDFSKKPKQP